MDIIRGFQTKDTESQRDATPSGLLGALVSETLLSRAALLARKGEYAAAESLLKQLLCSENESPRALDLLARIHAQQGRFSEAETFWKRALEVEPNNESYLAGLNRIAQMRSRPLWAGALLPMAAAFIAIFVLSLVGFAVRNQIVYLRESLLREVARASSAMVRTPTPTPLLLAILQPQPGAVISSPVTVIGRMGGFEGRVLVSVLDSQNNTLGEVQAITDPPAPGQAGIFAATVPYTEPVSDEPAKVKAMPEQADESAAIYVNVTLKGSGLTPSPTPTPMPIPCTQLIVNGGMENTSSWTIPNTAYPSGYSTARAHSGSRSLRVGIEPGGSQMKSYSSANQTIAVPSSAERVTLSFWYHSVSTAADADRQYVLILDSSRSVLATVHYGRSNAQLWTNIVYDLSLYRGQTIKLHFEIYNDGTGGLTSMYVDDVSVQACP